MWWVGAFLAVVVTLRTTWRRAVAIRALAPTWTRRGELVVVEFAVVIAVQLGEGIRSVVNLIDRE